MSTKQKDAVILAGGKWANVSACDWPVGAGVGARYVILEITGFQKLF